MRYTLHASTGRSTPPRTYAQGLVYKGLDAGSIILCHSAVPINIFHRLWQGVVIQRNPHCMGNDRRLTAQPWPKGSRPASLHFAHAPAKYISGDVPISSTKKAKFSNGSKRRKHSLRTLAALTPPDIQWGAFHKTRVHQPKSVISWPSILGLNLEALLRLCPDLAVIEYIFQTDPLRAQNHEYPSGIVLGVIQQAKG